MQIHWVDGDAFGAAQRELVAARIRELTQGRTDVIDVRITARGSGHHRRGGREVRIICEARGREIVAARTRADAGLALDQAMDVFERELKRLRERRLDARGQRERGAAPPELGVIDHVSDDHGFILTDAGERVYFHRNAVQGALAFERLEEGQRVGLSVEGGLRGPQASAVRPPPPGIV
jgi:cold shock CspA family protein/ribosome-associated translation inhibitor RaiA